MIDFGLSKMY